MKKILLLFCIILILLTFCSCGDNHEEEITYGTVSSLRQSVTSTEKAYPLYTDETGTITTEKTDIPASTEAFPKVNLEGCAYIPGVNDNEYLLSIPEEKRDYIGALITLGKSRAYINYCETNLPDYLSDGAPVAFSEYYPYKKYRDEMNYYIDSLLLINGIGIADMSIFSAIPADVRAILPTVLAQREKTLPVLMSYYSATAKEKEFISALERVVYDMERAADEAKILLADDMKGHSAPAYTVTWDDEKQRIYVEISGDENTLYSVASDYAGLKILYKSASKANPLTFYTTVNLAEIPIAVSGTFGEYDEYEFATEVLLKIDDFRNELPDENVEIECDFLRESLCDALRCDKLTARALSRVCRICVYGGYYIEIYVSRDNGTEEVMTYYGTPDIKLWYKAGAGKPFALPDPVIKIENPNDFACFLQLDKDRGIIIFNSPVYECVGFGENDIRALDNLRFTDILWIRAGDAE